MAVSYKVLGQAVVGSTRSFVAITNKVIATNVATLTTGAAHGFAIGDVVVVAGVDTTHDGTHVVASVPSSTTFTYQSTTATQATTAVTPNGACYRSHGIGGGASASKYSTGVNCVVTTGSAHGLAVNDWVRVEVGDANLDGLVKVIALPSASSFAYAKTASAVASTSITTGAFGKVMPASWTSLYTVPASTGAVISTLAVANQLTTAAQYRVGITTSASPALSEILIYDGTVAANDTITLSLGIALDAGKILKVMANSPEITFTAFGTEIA